MSGAPAVSRATAEDLPDCIEVRRVVFVEGQGVPLDLEVDGLDPACTHFLARRDGRVVATARLRATETGDLKAERVAVLPAWRGLGLGLALMEAVEAEARRLGSRRLVLHAQEAVIPFYRRLGYQGRGEGFVEAGIPHLHMEKELPEEAT